MKNHRRRAPCLSAGRGGDQLDRNKRDLGGLDEERCEPTRFSARFSRDEAALDKVVRSKRVPIHLSRGWLYSGVLVFLAKTSRAVRNPRVTPSPVPLSFYSAVSSGAVLLLVGRKCTGLFVTASRLALRISITK